MKLANWHTKEIFKRIEDKAYSNANVVMDKVVAAAKTAAPASDIYRPPGFSKAHIEFTPRTGRNKDNLVSFDTEKRWTGRKKGDLKNTIRRVNAKDTSKGNVRVYAGNFLIYWARYVEMGTLSTGWGGPAVAQPYLRPSFNEAKQSVLKDIAGGGVI